MERHLIGAAKAVAFLILFVAAVVTLLRGIVGPLWGAGSEYGLFGAVISLAVGIIALAWLARVMARDVSRHFKKDGAE